MQEQVVGYAHPLGSILRIPNAGIIFGSLTTVPSDTAAGFAPGCIFIDNDSTTAGAQVYINEGSATSCKFRPLNTSGASTIVTAITTLAVTKAAHSGKTILLSLLAGFTSTLPAATGSGDSYKFVIGIVNTTNSYIINTVGSDVFKGSLPLTTPASTYATANIGETFASTTGVHITINGTATGGASIGDEVIVQDIQTGVWKVTGWLTTTTTPLTPFS